MKFRTLVTAALAVLAFGGLTLGATTASAKGPKEVTLTGPGLAAPIRLTNSGEGSQLVHRLWQEAGIDRAMFSSTADAPLRADRPTDALGPRYVVTYHWLVAQDRTTPIRQELYPFADGGALAYTRAGQRVLDETSRGGWYRAGPDLTLLLVAVGVPVPASYALPVPIVEVPRLTG